MEYTYRLKPLKKTHWKQRRWTRLWSWGSYPENLELKMYWRMNGILQAMALASCRF